MTTLAGLLARSLHELLDGTRSEPEVIHSLRAALSHAPSQLRLVPNDPDMIVSIPAGADLLSKPDPREAAVRLFDYWRKVCNHPNARPDATRLAKALSRLRDGFTEQELRWAIDGMAGSEFHSGAKDGVRYDDMELCFRDIRHTEKFIERARGQSGGTPREARDEERTALRKQAQAALKEGRTADHDRLIRQLRSS